MKNIHLKKSEIKSAIERIKGTCDELGIRLGKEDAKAEKILCAALGYPNMHVLRSRTSNPELTPADSTLAAELNKVQSIRASYEKSLLSDPLLNQFKSPNDYFMRTLENVFKSDTITNCGKSIRDVSDLIDEYIERHPVRVAKKSINTTDEGLALHILLRFCEIVPTLLSGVDSMIAYKLNTLAIMLRVKIKECDLTHLPCPDCGNSDWEGSDSAGFTYPSDEHYMYVVCQDCGRRTLEDDWNSADEVSLDLIEEFKVNECYSALLQGENQTKDSRTPYEMMMSSTLKQEPSLESFQLLFALAQSELGEHFIPAYISHTDTPKFTKRKPLDGDLIQMPSGEIYTVDYPEGSTKPTITNLIQGDNVLNSEHLGETFEHRPVGKSCQ
ncbi:hypothetical protein VCHA53O466_50196 [Vibrio chagasii]|nr:hypothetical protein VCHA53O466_50196 [Vibrio chagasii]